MNELEMFEKEILKPFVEEKTGYILSGRNPLRGQKILKFCKTLQDDVVKPASITKASILKSNDSALMMLVGEGVFHHGTFVKNILKLADKDGKNPRYFVCPGKKFDNIVFHSFIDDVFQPLYQVDLEFSLDRKNVNVYLRAKEDSVATYAVANLYESEKN